MIASTWVGLTFPGIMEDPGSFSGRFNSPRPDRGPDAKKRKSFAIYWKAEDVYITSNYLENIGCKISTII